MSAVGPGDVGGAGLVSGAARDHADLPLGQRDGVPQGVWTSVGLWGEAIPRQSLWAGPGVWLATGGSWCAKPICGSGYRVGAQLL